ncbi:MAG: short-chain dehydrogenase [Deltaproteobacteria bacterium]|nr:short-chain dehydrogenase [Deltaproteobacteria bacterium]
MRLSNRRILVVGASSGVGLASGLAIAAEGGRVAFAARRVDRLEDAVAQAGNGSIAIACDVRDEASCASTVSQAVSSLGGLDSLVYAPGISSFKLLREIDAEIWREVLETNLIGASLMTRHAIGHLEAARGKAVFISSISIQDSPPRRGQAPYVVSKTALETLIRAWQGENRAVGFTSIIMGDTITEFGLNEGLDALIPLVTQWAEKDYLFGRTMEASSVATQVVNALASPETVRRIAITPNYAQDDRDAAELGQAVIGEVRGNDSQ